MFLFYDMDFFLISFFEWNLNIQAIRLLMYILKKFGNGSLGARTESFLSEFRFSYGMI